MPQASSPLPTVAALSQLPYLTACIHESTRLAHGVAGRLVRIAPDSDLVYGNNNIIIPRGATFSVSQYLQHMHPSYFPSPQKFVPERYLGEKGKEALKYLVPFGRGPRACLGINLAWAEMYLAFAALLSGFELELVETTEQDVTVVQEYFIGLFPRESKGVRVRIIGEQKKM